MHAANWFVGLPVAPADWLSRLTAPPPGVRVFAPQDLHITVAFLGPVDEEAARAGFEHARAWSLPPTQVELDRLVPMGAPRRPSALSTTLRDPGAVAQAIGEVRGAMFAAAGARPDTRPPLPHVTVARPRRRASDAERAAAVAWARAQRLGGVCVHLDRLALYTRAADRQQHLFDRVCEHSLESSED